MSGIDVNGPVVTGVTSDSVLAVTEEINKHEVALKNVSDALLSEVLRDRSPAAKRSRQIRMLKAAYGEFVGTTIFFAMIFSCIANGVQQSAASATGAWSSFDRTFGPALVSGFAATAVIYTFSSISGAHLNCGISFALWLTNKLSNRRCVFYIAVQLLASCVAMGLVSLMFPGPLQSIYAACAVEPANDQHLGKVFATEFICTFVLTYVAFANALSEAESEKKNNLTFKGISDTKGLTVYATSPQSKTGFAPLAIGLTVFTLAMVGGSSGAAFNPARMFGPAIFSGKWHYFYIYWIAELCGAAVAALLVNNLSTIGLESKTEKEIPENPDGTAAGVAKHIQPLRTVHNETTGRTSGLNMNIA